MQIVGEDPDSKSAGGKKEASEKVPNIFDNPSEPTDPNGVVDKDAEEDSRPVVPPANPGDRVSLNSNDYDQDELVVTPEEKAAFIESMLTGERYRETFSMFGGRVSVTLRSRTNDETNAMYSYIRHAIASRLDTGMLESNMTYVPLVVQVEEINGTKFPEMKKPYTFEESNGSTVDPGWLEDFNAWKKKPEGLTSALINRIQLFEYKYWLMVKEASNKNFWNSDTSSEE